MTKKEYGKIWREKNPMSAHLRAYRNRYIVLEHYSKGKLECACCSKDELSFLSIDHIKGKGNDDRKTRGMGSHFVDALIRENFPLGFQILCYNCNFARQTHGECPHNWNERK